MAFRRNLQHWGQHCASLVIYTANDVLAWPFTAASLGGNILHPHSYVAPMMFWRNFQHWGQQYVSSVTHIVDGIPTTPPTCIQALRVFFLHKSFCLLDDQCAFTIALLGLSFFSAKKMDLTRPK